MPTDSDKAKTAILKLLKSDLQSQSSKRELPNLERFARQFYANAPTADLVSRTREEIAGEVMSIWGFLAQRKPGTAKVNVFNPTIELDGWECPHTILQVVADDKPFLVDSVSAALSERGHAVNLVIHPVIQVKRNGKGQLESVLKPSDTASDGNPESCMCFEIGECNDPEELRRLKSEIEAVLKDVRLAVEDWQKVRGRVQSIINELKLRYSESAVGDIAEAQDFLQWVHDDHFTFLGYREYTFKESGKQLAVTVSPRTGLGILRDPSLRVFSELRDLAKNPPAIQRLVRRPEPLVINKADIKSRVHRPVHLDAIGVKKLDEKGKVIGERLIVGLFTSVAYHSSPRSIPLLRRKVDKTIARAGFAQAGHDGKALMNILETYPRDELFQIRDDLLLETSLSILNLQERQRAALFVRRDDFDRFVSCLVYIPRDRYTTHLRLRLQDILEEEFGGTLMSFQGELSDSPLARLHVLISTPGHKKGQNLDKIEARLTDAIQSWEDRLKIALSETMHEESSRLVFAKFGQAFPAAYLERFAADQAIEDIQSIEGVMDSGELGLDLYRPEGVAGHEVRLKIFNRELPIPLSDVLPILEHMGFKVIDERPHRVRPQGDNHPLVVIHDFGLVRRSGARIDLNKVRDNFHEVFRRVWRGEMESDGFNGLVFRAHLSWREIVILRTYAKYLRQAQAPFSQDYMEQALRNNPDLARRFVALFEAKFDPAAQSGHNRRVVQIRQNILDALDLVDSADEDRVLRRFLNLVEASLRTNFYQTTDDGLPKYYLSIKLDSTEVDELPLPRPLREIFVYAPRFEAIHLRGGMVARGGLRWSDRPEDFRTEILGLMKAQMVKNTVIVPVGSKGGFVVKRPPTEGGREAFLQEGIECYKMFMGGLLDVTDNLKGDSIIPPQNVVRTDGDDPYLVVAADKGTATFSDIANGVAIDYGFWLGDAFASGGSVGYDHKKMGITARGAWESVKRHFREIGKDIQKEEFSVVGVGDMSGDVFGNGMLLSKKIKLNAAFNHLHIFLDPDPDPAKSWAERNRLFKLPRSSWTDYNKKLISKGGGIFERSAKSINLSPEIREVLDIHKSTVTPNELMTAILKAPAELMWFGGIGTYIKATTESDADVGDRTNDAIRVNAPELRCQVIGEGANLGVTHPGRIQFGLLGGRLNADSIDNSAGVDCSDHEVNIKILLNDVVGKRKLTVPARNKLLESMTDEVGDLVLRDNYLQSQAITLDQALGGTILDVQSRFMRFLERADRLDRAVEHLPNDEVLEERIRDKKGLARPEIAVLLSYAKLWLYDEILASDLPDQPVLEEDLIDYFPTALRTKYKTEIKSHKLRREIITTVVTNDLINRVGTTFLLDRKEKTGANVTDVARAFIVARDAFGLQEIWNDIEALDNKVPAKLQTILLNDVNQLVERATLSFLRTIPQPMKIGAVVTAYAPGIKVLANKLQTILPKEVTSRVDHRVDRYVAQGVPRGLASRVAYLLLMVSACDIIRVAGSTKLNVAEAAKLYFQVGESLGLGWLRYNAERLPGDTHWQKLAAEAVIEELYGHQRGITLRIVSAANGHRADAFDRWQGANEAPVTQIKQMLNELESAEQVDLSMLAVASRNLSAIAGVS